MNDTLLYLKQYAPFNGNGIYLEKNNKESIAVCSNDKIASEIAKILNEIFIISNKDKETANLYKKIIISCYYLLIAIEQCHIYVNSINTQILQHSHDELYNLMQQLFSLHPEILKNLEIDTYTNPIQEQKDLSSNNLNIDQINSNLSSDEISANEINSEQINTDLSSIQISSEQINTDLNANNLNNDQISSKKINNIETRLEQSQDLSSNQLSSDLSSNSIRSEQISADEIVSDLSLVNLSIDNLSNDQLSEKLISNDIISYDLSDQKNDKEKNKQMKTGYFHRIKMYILKKLCIYVNKLSTKINHYN